MNTFLHRGFTTKLPFGFCILLMVICQKRHTPPGCVFFDAEWRDLNNLNARLRGSLARPRLDGDDTIILSNPSISAADAEAENGLPHQCAHWFAMTFLLFLHLYCSQDITKSCLRAAFFVGEDGIQFPHYRKIRYIRHTIECMNIP